MRYSLKQNYLKKVNKIAKPRHIIIYNIINKMVSHLNIDGKKKKLTKVIFKFFQKYRAHAQIKHTNLNVNFKNSELRSKKQERIKVLFPKKKLYFKQKKLRYYKLTLYSIHQDKILKTVMTFMPKHSKKHNMILGFGEFHEILCTRPGDLIIRNLKRRPPIFLGGTSKFKIHQTISKRSRFSKKQLKLSKVAILDDDIDFMDSIMEMIEEEIADKLEEERSKAAEEKQNKVDFIKNKAILKKALEDFNSQVALQKKQKWAIKKLENEIEAELLFRRVYYILTIINLILVFMHWITPLNFIMLSLIFFYHQEFRIFNEILTFMFLKDLKKLRYIFMCNTFFFMFTILPFFFNLVINSKKKYKK